MQITRDQVAKMAKVSSATVSRVFNSPEAVSPPLREAVLHASQELGYTPNKTAGMLRRRGTGVIAFVELEKVGRPYYWGNLESFDWFFGRSIRGVQEAIKDTSWQLMFYKIRTKMELQTLGRHCDGILAYDVDTEEEVSLFRDLTVPYVLSHHLSKEAAASVVVTDNYYGGVLQAQFLKRQLCTSPLYITGYLESVVPHQQRLQGFLSLFPDTHILETHIGKPEAILDILGMVATMTQDGVIDSIAAVNDLTLFELLLKSRSALPSIGYDGSPFYRLFSGPLASVDIQSGEIYKRATKELLLLIGGSEAEPKVVLPTLAELFL
ncbi:MAG: LacI family DNA-binding transcriptional regulator [Sphaerochaeta sp.]|nr:LacI family DNA-binding transcriptional regulator [Sphaerochaeta sp.]